MHDLAGHPPGPYRLLEVLGTGGTATVYIIPGVPGCRTGITGASGRTPDTAAPCPYGRH